MNPALPSGTGGSGKMPNIRVALIDDSGNYHLSMSKRTTNLTIFMIGIIW